MTTEDLFVRPWWMPGRAAVPIKLRLLSRPLWLCPECYADQLEGALRGECRHAGRGLTAAEVLALDRRARGEQVAGLEAMAPETAGSLAAMEHLRPAPSARGGQRT